MPSRAVIAAALIILAATAMAETPNIQPGLWEYTNDISFEGDMPIPDQSESSQDCISEEDVAEGDAFLEDVDECEFTHKDMRSDGMNYTMICQSPDGVTMEMEADMQFNGDTVSGVINGNMESPMGPVSTRIEMEGRRIGDC